MNFDDEIAQFESQLNDIDKEEKNGNQEFDLKKDLNDYDNFLKENPDEDQPIDTKE